MNDAKKLKTGAMLTEFGSGPFSNSLNNMLFTSNNELQKTDNKKYTFDFVVDEADK